VPSHSHSLSPHKASQHSFTSTTCSYSPSSLGGINRLPGTRCARTGAVRQGSFRGFASHSALAGRPLTHRAGRRAGLDTPPTRGKGLPCLGDRQ
jgi:hypothetical protein